MMVQSASGGSSLCRTSFSLEVRTQPVLHLFSSNGGRGPRVVSLDLIGSNQKLSEMLVLETKTNADSEGNILDTDSMSAVPKLL